MSDAFDTSVELTRALLWQHENAARLKSLIQQKQAWYESNHSAFWDDWVRDVFDLTTCNEFGAQVWGRILGVKLEVSLGPTSHLAFGFGAGFGNFGRSTFGRKTNGTARLSIENKRLLLRARYLQLTNRGSIPRIDWLLHVLLGDKGLAYAQDLGNMRVRIFFAFIPDAQLRFLLENFEIIPRPAGVEVDYVFQRDPAFGYGSYNLNFNRGAFAHG